MIVKLVNARLAFPQLFEAKTVNGEGKPAFSASLIIKKDAPEVKTLNGIFEELAREKWGTKGEAVLKGMRAADKLCLHDGDLKEQYDGFPGHYFISARNSIKPRVVDRSNEPLNATDGLPYAGCYVNASIELWAQDNNYGKRINATLRGVQFVKDGEAFAAGKPPSEDEFDSLGDDAEGLV